MMTLGVLINSNYFNVESICQIQLLFVVAGPHTAGDFHRRVTQSIELFRDCTKTRSDRACAYEKDVLSRSTIEVTLGLYYIFINDWLKVVPRDQLYTITTDEWVQDRPKALVNIMQFLDLDTSEGQGSPEFISNHHDNGHRQPMLEKTKTLLTKFYSPYNIKLAELLNDDRYMWEATRSQ